MRTTFSVSRPPRAPRVRARVRRWAVLGALLGAGLSLWLFAPARWLAAAVAQASQGQVQLQGARGSVWNGSAQLVLTGGRNSRDATALPGRLHWRIRPDWRGATLALWPDCCARQPLQVTVQAGWQRVRVAVGNHQSEWPTSLLQGLGAPWNTLQLDGQLQLAFEDYAVQWVQGRVLMQGQVQASLRHASSSLTTLRPMGSYRLIMQGEEAVTLSLVTDAGPLLLQGQGQWTGQRLRFQGQASAQPEHLPALSNLLSLMGRRDGPRAILSF